MKSLHFIAMGVFVIILGCSQGPVDLVIDNFEGDIHSETVDFGASEESSVEVAAERTIKASGMQSLKIEYVLKPSGYMWVARGYNLDVKGAGQWQIRPEEIKWSQYNALKLSMYGSNAGGVVALDIKDAGGEMWRFLLDDDFEGWKEITCRFNDFFVRRDWQPETADRNEVLDFPLMSFQFERRLPGEGTYYFDCIKLAKVKKSR
ncbi:MAG: hypothetical protein JSW40_07335 [Candidatus Omnitrophota bacterium]|nr:MAG: hypothetical protein JSW40_07335 [Candidatus Omnitrophota bacterium]